MGFALDVLTAAEHRDLVGLTRLQPRNRNGDEAVFFSGLALGAKAGGAVITPFPDLIPLIGGENREIARGEILLVDNATVVSLRPGTVLVERRLRGKRGSDKKERQRICKQVQFIYYHFLLQLRFLSITPISASSPCASNSGRQASRNASGELIASA